MRRADTPPFSRISATSRRLVATADYPSLVPTLELLASVYGAAPPVRDPGWFERDPRASPIDTNGAKQRLGWRPTSMWAEVAARLET